uniref:NAD(P)/FAD-dependent oxidoreductase n=1 Tax=Aggregatilinea sp. TaxID=2806333 RepID=UPI002B664A74
MNDSHPYDVIVIGAGAAGLLAAGHAATEGARTLLLEKMHHPGRKIKITGKGRCNVTNTAPLSEFIGHFGPNGRFLRHAFNTYFSQDLIEHLHALDVPTVTERGGRVFPASGEAEHIVEGLVRWVREMGVQIEPFAPVERLLVEDDRISGVHVAEVPPGRTRTGAPHAFPARTYRAPSVIVATGGASYAATGSTGDGYRLAE